MTLLTSVYFRCHPGLAIVDAAGPLGSLCTAAAAAIALGRSRQGATEAVFLALLLAFSGLWGAGCCILSAATDTSDLAFVLRDLSLQPRWAWRLALGIAGIWLYVIVLRRAATGLPTGTPLLAAYCTAGAVACLSVLFYPGVALTTLKEVALESLLAPVGLLFVAASRTLSRMSSLPFSRAIVLAAAATVAVFWLTLGRGLSGI